MMRKIVPVKANTWHTAHDLLLQILDCWNHKLNSISDWSTPGVYFSQSDRLGPSRWEAPVPAPDNFDAHVIDELLPDTVTVESRDSGEDGIKPGDKSMAEQQILCIIL